MKPAAGAPDTKDIADTRPIYEVALDNNAYAEAQPQPEERDPNAYGEFSKEEEDIKKPFQEAAENNEDKNEALEMAAIALPPYIVATKGDGETMYTLVLPDSVRPISWPIATPIGGDAGKGAQSISGKAWSLYGEALTALHAEQMEKHKKEDNKDIAAITLGEVAESYRKTTEYKKMPDMERDSHDMNTHKMMDWSAINGHPPIQTIMPEHVRAMLMKHPGDDDSTAAMKESMVALYDHAIELGYVKFNPAASAPLPDAQWKAAVKRNPISTKIDMFGSHPQKHTDPHSHENAEAPENNENPPELTLK